MRSQVPERPPKGSIHTLQNVDPRPPQLLVRIPLVQGAQWLPGCTASTSVFLLGGFTPPTRLLGAAFGQER